MRGEDVIVGDLCLRGRREVFDREGLCCCGVGRGEGGFWVMDGYVVVRTGT